MNKKGSKLPKVNRDDEFYDPASKPFLSKTSKIEGNNPHYKGKKTKEGSY